MQPSFARRRFIQSAAATGSFLACYGVMDRARAAIPVRITPPIVDQLTIQVVVDSAYGASLPDAPNNATERERMPTPAAAGGKTLEGQWGLSLHLVSTKGKDTRRYLLDFAATPDVLTNNLTLLKIDPPALDALILSSGHLAHMGGLVGFLQANRSEMREELRLYVGGEDTFCHRLQQQPDGLFVPHGVLDRHDLKAQRVQPVLSELPIIIEDHAFTTGIIPRASIETVMTKTFVAYGESGGVGCNTIKYGDDHEFTNEELAGKPVPDQQWHEHATCFQVGNRGLVVITACGHAGILNIVQRAQDITGIDHIHALCGGFHLASASEDYLDAIMAELKQLSIDHLIPMHCSGSNFLEAAKREMPEKLVLSTTGSLLTFTA